MTGYRLTPDEVKAWKASAQPVIDAYLKESGPLGAKLYAEKTCAACHGPTGNKALMPAYPKIAGQNAKYLEKQMLDIKSGARANGNSAAMKGVMPLVSDEQIKVLAGASAGAVPIAGQVDYAAGDHSVCEPPNRNCSICSRP